MKLPQLTLRDLFWLLLVVGMGCAWWVERSRLVGELATSRAAESNCRLCYEHAQNKLVGANHWFHKHGYYLHADGTVMEIPIP